MAIVNLTPDSFSGDGLADRSLGTILEQACAALDAGADIVDLGAESTRPGATPLSADQEQARLLPVLGALRRERPQAILSIDTYHADTARAAAALGAEIINDVSGLTWDETMAETVAETGCGLVLMHTRGRPAEWRTQPPLHREAMLADVVQGLARRLAMAEAAGVPRQKIALDPGFGFGKLGTANFALLAELSRLQAFSRGLLVGLSRKGFLGEAVRSVQTASQAAAVPAFARHNATLAAHVGAVLAGVHILRVHDLQASREAAAVADALLAAATDTHPSA